MTLEEQIRDLAVLASIESEDEISEALLLIVRGSRLPRAIRSGFVNAVAGLLEAAEILSERQPATSSGGLSMDDDDPPPVRRFWSSAGVGKSRRMRPA